MKQLFVEESQNYKQISSALHPILKNEFGEKIYSSWLSKMKFYAFEDYEIILSVTSKFLRDWIRREYLNKVLIKLEETESTLLMGFIAEEEEVKRELGVTHKDILEELIRVARLILEIKDMLEDENE